MVIIGALVKICCSQRKRTGVGGLGGGAGRKCLLPCRGAGICTGVRDIPGEGEEYWKDHIPEL